MRSRRIDLALAAALALSCGPARADAPVPLSLPGGAPGIGFDDLGFSARLGRVLVPAGRSGRLDLVDPRTRAVTAIEGFSASPHAERGHDFGVTSVDDDGRRLLVTDRTARKLELVDPKARAIVGAAPLAGGPDYVRSVGPGEVWVTEPDAEQIEIFRVPEGAHPKPIHAGTISVPGGPESLVVDRARGRAYANLWGGQTVAIDLAKRKLVARWDNGCKGSRGLALDGARGLLLVGCAEGAASVIGLSDGKLRGHLASGRGVDIIAYSPSSHHLFLPGGRSATMAILDVAGSGALKLVETVPTAPGAHCVASDDAGHAWVCDPGAGRLLVVSDPR